MLIEEVDKYHRHTKTFAPIPSESRRTRSTLCPQSRGRYIQTIYPFIAHNIYAAIAILLTKFTIKCCV